MGLFGQGNDGVAHDERGCHVWMRGDVGSNQATRKHIFHKQFPRAGGGFSHIVTVGALGDVPATEHLGLPGPPLHRKFAPV